MPPNHTIGRNHCHRIFRFLFSFSFFLLQPLRSYCHGFNHWSLIHSSQSPSPESQSHCQSRVDVNVKRYHRVVASISVTVSRHSAVTVIVTILTLLYRRDYFYSLFFSLFLSRIVSFLFRLTPFEILSCNSVHTRYQGILFTFNHVIDNIITIVATIFCPALLIRSLSFVIPFIIITNGL